jgi:hypothetical protein
MTYKPCRTLSNGAFIQFADYYDHDAREYHFWYMLGGIMNRLPKSFFFKLSEPLRSEAIKAVNGIEREVEQDRIRFHKEGN